VGLSYIYGGLAIKPMLPGAPPLYICMHFYRNVIYCQSIVVFLCRDLFTDERQARSERASRDLLQSLLVGSRPFHGST